MSSEEKQMDLPAKPRRMGRLFFLVAGVVCAAGITGGMMAVGSRPTAAPTRSAPAKVPVHVTIARIDDVRQEIRLVGTVLPLKDCPSSNDLRLFGLWKNGVSGSVCGLI
ncbi:hypothetical protein BJ928_1371 [Rhizobium sp. WW_1]|nr:hypothetical protein BJ928_1371 [Rhizobium sp. WW_1]